MGVDFYFNVLGALFFFAGWVVGGGGERLTSKHLGEVIAKIILTLRNAQGHRDAALSPVWAAES